MLVLVQFICRIGNYFFGRSFTLAHSNITIAGQTSPGKGICVKGAPFGFSGVTDGIMRFIRVRVGSGRTFMLLE